MPYGDDCNAVVGFKIDHDRPPPLPQQASWPGFRLEIVDGARSIGRGQLPSVRYGYERHAVNPDALNGAALTAVVRDGGWKNGPAGGQTKECHEQEGKIRYPDPAANFSTKPKQLQTSLSRGAFFIMLAPHEPMGRQTGRSAGGRIGLV
jgi:hypothetical protein